MDPLDLQQRIEQLRGIGRELIQQLDAVLDKNISRLERIANGFTVTNTTAFNVDEKVPPKAQPVS